MYGEDSFFKEIDDLFLSIQLCTYMQSTSWETLGWKKHKLESGLPGEISNLRYADDTTLMAESKEELKSPLIKVKEESEKVQHSEN